MSSNVSKTNCVTGKPKSDVWSKTDDCVVCQVICKTEEEKKVHEEKQSHVKKISIYNFLSKEAANLASSDLPSALLRRFTVSKERAIGLECINEIRFPWCASGWWVCSICYDSGSTFEQAEHHVRSVRHLSTYLEEFNPEKAARVEEHRRDPVEHYEQLINARNELYKEQGEFLLPPEILDLKLTKEEAMAKLVVSGAPSPGRSVFPVSKEEDTTKRAIIRCSTCHEVFPCFKKNLNKVWSVHENSPHHRRCAAITGILNQLSCEEVVDAEVFLDEGPYNWKRINGVYFGPVCGISYLLTCGSENYCTLCFSKVNSIEEHFSSENHINQFMAVKKTSEYYAIHQYCATQRRSRVAELLMETTLDTDSHRKLPSNFLPSLILEFSDEEMLDAVDFMPPVVGFGFDKQCLICEECSSVIQVPKDSSHQAIGIWNEHVESAAHFDFKARRSSFRFDDEFFVPMLSSVALHKPSLHGEWKDVMLDETMSYRIQTQCDVGLQYVVEDQENSEVVCLLCARTYKKDSKEAIKNHVRSFMHLSFYLNMDNRELLAIMMEQSSEQSSLDLIMDWLKRNSKMSQSIVYDPAFMQPVVIRENWNQIRVYSPDKAVAIAKKHNVPSRLISLPFVDPSLRPLVSCIAPVIDTVANDGAEKESLDLRQALSLSSCRIIHMDDQDNLQTRRWLFRCMTCQIVFSTTVEHIVRDVFEHHMHSEEHDQKINAFQHCKLDMCGFAENSSTYTVKPFIQQDLAKKLTWQWNAKEEIHDFVLCVVGLDDLVERKSNFIEGQHNPDFFCRLCAQVLPRRAAVLEAHVRSGKHVMSYVHKYHPMTVFEIDSLKADDGRVMRRMVAQLLKDVNPPSEYCIPVYDPIGEQERKGEIAMAKAKEAERLKSIEDSRKKAQEARIARDEERRKILALELEREKQRRAERAKREAEVMERTAQMAAEKERIKQIAEAERVRLRRVAEDRVKETVAREKEERDRAETDRRQRERNNMKAMLEQEKAKLKSLQDREKAMRLTKEKQELEMKRSALLEKAANLQKPVSEPKLLIAPQLASQPMSMMSMPPPMMMSHNYGMPPPPFVSLDLLGPKPSFETFSVTAEAMPVYPMGEEDMDLDSRSRSSSRSRSDSRHRRRRSRSRSRSRDRRFHRRSRSRSRSRKHRSDLRDVSGSPVDVTPAHIKNKNTAKAKVPGERSSIKGRAVDMYVTSPNLIGTRPQLVDFIWRQGAEKIPDDELPTAFSKKATEVEGNVGVDSIYEVVCVDNAELDTFYCSICGVWTTPSEMLKHVSAPEHKLAYLYRNYKPYHDQIKSETVSLVRHSMLTQFTLQIWKREQPPPEVCNRLRTVLDRATIIRLWPEHIHVLDHSWKQDGMGVSAPVSKDVFSDAFNGPPSKTVPPPSVITYPQSSTPSAQPAPASGVSSAPAQAKTAEKKGSSDKDKEKKKKEPSPRSTRRRSTSRERRHRSRSPRRRRSKSPSRRSPTSKRRRSKSPPRRSRSRDRIRRRSRSRDRNRRSSSRDRKGGVRSRNDKDKTILSKDDLSWVDQAASFLEKLGDVTAANNIRSQTQSAPQQFPPVPGVSTVVPLPVPFVSQPTVAPTSKPMNLIYTKPPPPIVTLPTVRITGQQQPVLPPPMIQKPQQPEVITLDDEPPARDEKAEMRKLLGMLITMQQEAERNGGLEASTVDRLYQEFGLKKTEGLNSDQLLAQLLSQLAGHGDHAKSVDLSSFGIASSSPAASTSTPYPVMASRMQQPPPHQVPPPNCQQYRGYQQPPSYSMPQQQQQQKQDTNPQLQKILSSIGDSMASLRSSRPPSPILKPNPYRITRTEDIYGDSGVSFVYPDGSADNTETTSSAAQPTPSLAPPLVPVPAPDSKKEKAAMRRKMLLEQAEQLRKQAEEEADDDDWSTMETEMSQIMESAGKSTASKNPPVQANIPAPVNQPKMGVPVKWAQPVPQPTKQAEPVQSSQQRNSSHVTPIAPGQKMPLPRTFLPNGKLPTTLEAAAAAPSLAPKQTPPAAQQPPAVPQPTPAQYQYPASSVVAPTNFTQPPPQHYTPQQYVPQPIYYPQQQYGYMQPQQQQQYPYVQQQGYAGMNQQYMQQPTAPGAYPQGTTQPTTQQQYYYGGAQGGQYRY